MKLVSKDAVSGSITIFTRLRNTAISNYDYKDNVDAVPDPILGNGGNSHIRFRSDSFGYCEVDWGDGIVESIPFTKKRGTNEWYVYFRTLNIEWFKNPDSHPWWFWKEDGSEYIPVPPHMYQDKSTDERIVSFKFTNDVQVFLTHRSNMRLFPVLDMPGLKELSLSIISSEALMDIPVDRIKRSVNIERIELSDGGHAMTSIPESWKSLVKMKNLVLSRSGDFHDTEMSNIRKLPDMFPDLESLNLNGTFVKVFPREWIGFKRLTSLQVASDRRRPDLGYDPDTMLSMDEVDTINPSLTTFKHLGDWYNYDDQKTWHEYMSGKGLENIGWMWCADNFDIPATPPDYMYEMRSMTGFNTQRAFRSQERTDEFMSKFYEFVTGWENMTMTSTAKDGKRNQFYGLSVSHYSSTHPSGTYRPSGDITAPDGFIKGQSNGSPSTPGQMLYVLINNYGQKWTLPPVSTRSRSYTPPYALVGKDSVWQVMEGDIMADDVDIVRFGGQPEGEDICDRMGIDKNIVINYFREV